MFFSGISGLKEKLPAGSFSSLMFHHICAINNGVMRKAIREVIENFKEGEENASETAR